MTEATMTSQNDRSTASSRPRRKWLLRCVAIALGLAPFLFLELTCRLMGWGRPDLSVDPFVGFKAIHPLFVLNDRGDRYEIPLSRRTFFRFDSFAAEKPADEFRVFCLGGSTVQGRPFAIETSFTTWLELSMQAAQPDRRWDVINCGGVSYATYRLIPILQEVLTYQPDLIILYTGHNEFLEDRSFEHIRHRSEWVNQAIAAADELRSFHVLRNGWLQLTQAESDGLDQRPLLPAEVDALLDERGGLDAYHRDEAWREDIIEQYRFNLNRMVELTQAAGVPVVLVNPVSNLRDCPPFKAEHRSDLSAEELDQWETLCDLSCAQLTQKLPDIAEAIRLFEQACEIDPQHAGGLYNLARCYDRAGRKDEARTTFVRAKDEDICPLRILEPMHEAVFEIAEETGVPLCDAQTLFGGVSPDGIVDGVWLVDHVHPSIKGHQLLADALLDLLISLGTVHPQKGWRDLRQQAYQAHEDSLGSPYYAKGMQRLEVVEKWARGRAEGGPRETDTTSPQVLPTERDVPE
ncbi:MAG: tetratricopeptide repeat protein [Planctomycetaceae bacterium]|nr:tetratricopeptide repeat protein [Planctomycetaceae bacterium]